MKITMLKNFLSLTILTTGLVTTVFVLDDLSVSAEPKKSYSEQQQEQIYQQNIQQIRNRPSNIPNISPTPTETKDGTFYYNRGVAKSNSGDNSGAISDFDRAIALNPQDADAYYNRGNAKSSLGQKQGAIADFSYAIALNPKDDSAYNNRGVAKSSLGQKQEAIADFDRAISLNLQSASAYNNRGKAKSSLGDKKGAIEDLTKAAELFQKRNQMGLYNSTMDLLQKIK